LGIWDWGLGIGDWELGPIPNPQSPIPNPHFIQNKYWDEIIFRFKKFKLFDEIN